MKTAYEIKRNAKETIEKSVLDHNPSLKSVQDLPEDARTKIDELTYEYSSFLLDMQQIVLNSDKVTSGRGK